MAPSPLGPRSAPVSAWTGTELLVWSGIPSTSDACGTDEGGGPLCGEPAVFDGAAYNPATDTWRTIAEGPVPAGGAPTQVIPEGVWTGSELVVWGGWASPIAAAYDPVTDRWRDLPPGPLADRQGQAWSCGTAGLLCLVASNHSGRASCSPASMAHSSTRPPGNGHRCPTSRPVIR